MTEGVHFCAPTQVKVAGPLIFLAGPIQGAADWQGEAFSLLRAVVPTANVASPRRNTEEKGEFTAKMYEEQVDWEFQYLRRAAENGVILFWLAKEAVHFERRAYAQTSRFELGWFLTMHRFGRARVALGVEEGFSGSRYVNHFCKRLAPDVLVNSSLAETCSVAANMSGLEVVKCRSK